ncbi:MAG: hypothetical protein AVDCRST_MAG72-362, partial [uncultured Nocardioidaceae bacterium]
ERSRSTPRRAQQAGRLPVAQRRARPRRTACCRARRLAVRLPGRLDGRGQAVVAQGDRGCVRHLRPAGRQLRRAGRLARGRGRRRPGGHHLPVGWLGAARARRRAGLQRRPQRARWPGECRTWWAVRGHPARRRAAVGPARAADETGL